MFLIKKLCINYEVSRALLAVVFSIIKYFFLDLYFLKEKCLFLIRFFENIFNGCSFHEGFRCGL